jgi:hypothetical protein
MISLFSLRGVFDSFKRLAKLHEAIGDLYVCGSIKPRLCRFEAFEAQIDDLLDYHSVVSGFKKSVDVFELVRLIVHF